MTTCYPDSIKVKRDIQRRIEDHVIKYCETLEENFKQYSLRMFETNIEDNRFPENTKYYQDRINEINDGTANLYKFVYKTGKKFHKVGLSSDGNGFHLYSYISKSSIAQCSAVRQSTMSIL